ncbi:DUF2971 domain-containing protein [Planctellipticum variicoloris]|uniref:DUF2971 domain-containing protein n=1 Tax=Planctellipticum variicoloris TaxID=3064265 RepID=UPI0030133335|nr:DUF2971 domain-containing protein [Planctomycetaceae bacterium SH412]
MPYRSHDDLEIPPDETVIWRYLSFDKFMSMMTTRTLWFSHPAKFDDKWEGWYPFMKLPAESEWSSEDEHRRVRQRIAEGHDRNRDQVLINCWQKAEHESSIMWRAYTPQGQGVAIRSTVGAFKKALDDAVENVHFGNVRYVDYSTDLAERWKRMPIFYVKQPQFEGESEFRATISRFSASNPGQIPSWDVTKVHDGIGVKVDLQKLLEGVVISPGCWNRWHTIIELAVQHAGVDSGTVEASSLDREHQYAEFVEPNRQAAAVKDAFDVVAQWLQEESFFPEIDRYRLAFIVRACRDFIGAERIAGVDYRNREESEWQKAAEKALSELKASDSSGR